MLKNTHTNVFLAMNGLPYILAEYADNRHFQQIDPSIIKNEIVIDQSESMRSVIDISIDDIGKNASDGRLCVTGNETKKEQLLEMIRANYQRLDHQVPVMRRGISIRVNYQIEDSHTGQVIRTLVETLKIPERNYFFYVNPDDVDDNAIIINFSDSVVSTINQSTHGTHPMRMRITSLQLSYDCVRMHPVKPRVTRNFEEDIPVYQGPADTASDNDLYYYHQKTQTRMSFGGGYPKPQWGNYCIFNTFYHYDEQKDDFILHYDEINDMNCKILSIPCGQIQVNRTFMVNPGSRLIFKFSIWKNDAVLVNSAKEVADVLRVPPYFPPCPPIPEPVPYPVPVPQPTWPYPYWPWPNPTGKDREFELIMKLFDMNKHEDKKQDEELKDLAKAVKELADLVKKPHPPKPHPHPGPHPLPPGVDAMIKMIKKLQKTIDEFIETHEDIELDPITDEQIQEILDNIEADWEDNGEYDDSIPPLYPDDGEGGDEDDSTGDDLDVDNPHTEG